MSSRRFWFSGRFVGASCQCLQQLPRILKVASPQQSRAFAGQPVGGISRGGVVGNHNLFGRRCTAFRAPDGRAGISCVWQDKI